MEQSSSQDSENTGQRGAWDNFREQWRFYHTPRAESETENQDTPSPENPEEIKKREIKETGERAMQDLDNLADEIAEKEKSSELGLEEENREYKKAKKEELKKLKYAIQQYDTVLDKERSDNTKHKKTPLFTDRNWRDVRSVYQKSWEDVRLWGIERDVWNEDDQKEYERQIDQLRYPKNWEKTRGTIYLGLYGVYAVNKILFEQTFKHMGMLGSDFNIYKDYQDSAKMIDAWIHPKPGKGKGQKKPEKLSAIKEHENNIKIREIHIKLARKNREEMERESIFEGENKKEYAEFWRKLRVYYIREGAWDKQKEKEFREELHNLGPGFELQRRDLLTEEERKKINDAPGKKTRKERELRAIDTAPQPLSEQQLLRKEKLTAELEEINKEIEEIEKSEEDRRRDETLWPPYAKSGGRQRSGEGIVDVDVGIDETQTQVNEQETDNEGIT